MPRVEIPAQTSEVFVQPMSASHTDFNHQGEQHHEIEQGRAVDDRTGASSRHLGNSAIGMERGCEAAGASLARRGSRKLRRKEGSQSRYFSMAFCGESTSQQSAVSSQRSIRTPVRFVNEIGAGSTVEQLSLAEHNRSTVPQTPIRPEQFAACSTRRHMDRLDVGRSSKGGG